MEGDMAEELSPGCARPTGSVVGEASMDVNGQLEERKEKIPVNLIGKKAPDFTAPGYHHGKFVNVKLSDCLGRWVLLCFYPGDFTFV
jgi:AhpC/TSA family